MDAIQIRALKSLSEMQAAVDLQKIYWGDDLESVIPAHMLFSIASHGGHVLTAWDGDQMVGVLVGFLGTSEEDTDRPAMSNLQLVSKRMVVLPDYRGHGIGYTLKLAQRQLAIKQGIRLVTWTFDPLLATNAHLNIRKLAGICPRYFEDYYGTSEKGGLAALGSSDRLLVEWWVTNRRVEERLNGKRGDLTLEQYLEAHTPLVNPTSADIRGVPWPSEETLMPTGGLALLEIPANYPAIISSDPVLARAWRLHTRDLFRRLLTAGFSVTDFLHTPYQGRDRAFYLLSRVGSSSDSSLF